MSTLTSAERDALIEAVVSAYRERDPRTGEIRECPAFHDLDAAGRLEAHDRATETRRIEAALDPAGRSTTVLAVLRTIRSAR